MKDISLLGIGNSSVGGFKWFLLGYNFENVYVITQDHMHDENNKIAWNIKQFRPTSDTYFDCELPDKTVTDLISFCKLSKETWRNYWPWNNNKKALKKYTKYLKLKPK